MKRLALAFTVGAVVVVGVASLCTAAPGAPGPPCETDPNLQCLAYMDPVKCVKPGVGWKTYANGCYALKDCALMHTCHPVGGGPTIVPAD